MKQALTAIIDHAALFPPASCGMEEAVRRHAEYRSGPDCARLGRFILPAGRLRELVDTVVSLGIVIRPDDPWGLSVILGPDTMVELGRIAEFESRARPPLRVEALETRADSVVAIDRLAELLPDRWLRFIELPHDADFSATLAALHEHGMAAKFRTGGVAPEHFPSSSQLARFIVAAVRSQVPFKATAGLHHPIGGSYPLTYEADSPRHVMFGYINLLAATALAIGGAGEELVEAALGEDGTLNLSDTGIVWRDHKLTTADLEAARDSFRGFGSCSFREPVDELQLEMA